MTKKKEEKIDYKKVAEDLAVENAQLNEAMLRERADAMNVRKRAEDEKLKLSGFYKSLVVKELLPFIDNLDRAMTHAPLISKISNLESNKEWKDWFNGLKTVKKQLDDTLTRLNVERIKTVGEHFDPELHEAVTMEEGDGEHEIVSEELQSGYTMNGEVLRHAMVRVKS